MIVNGENLCHYTKQPKNIKNSEETTTMNQTLMTAKSGAANSGYLLAFTSTKEQTFEHTITYSRKLLVTQYYCCIGQKQITPKK